VSVSSPILYKTQSCITVFTKAYQLSQRSCPSTGLVLCFVTCYISTDMIYLTAIELPPGGSSTVHIYTQRVQRTTQSTQAIHRTTHFTNWDECGPCPIFARYTLAFALQLREKHGKTSVIELSAHCLAHQYLKSISSISNLRICGRTISWQQCVHVHSLRVLC